MNKNISLCFKFEIALEIECEEEMLGCPNIKAYRLMGNTVKNAVLQRIQVVNPIMPPIIFCRFKLVSSARMEEHGFESTTIDDILKAKGKGADGSWLWCTTDDTVYNAVKSMTQHNVGALVVVNPGEQKSIAGIITERGLWEGWKKNSWFKNLPMLGIFCYWSSNIISRRELDKPKDCMIQTALKPIS
ncbi:CBS domain-containing protein CBSX3, mitochondrial-like isoform X3 [Durio zibethinus]|uniref:CBS domain-containing protein CBSX3, mitochondrial-like isoform X3 n=1 Tax=Durio zibethinus TaxID=66656 RepID=A0A6P5X9W0_DURZI|nr:CBS domain-containing protein CBSX3, mitochondrial-like isoform X3 [Durio zibethinus]